ncbi:hypothetical protein Tfer_1411 [Thermincola ferriacetica]|uniref:Flagellar Assembly Protein A N-terminal region domain-containing protein n=1 Tax=Thermincola ferriacetica TaxID=281456 RepID=A0A0L6W2V5_9FIRM|nr:flagellar assembly protein A [Thermincola ferriacetica]KNZ69801.1 hypothetical protein Tfer_1411 [Thermincola ferriacetica]
MRKIEDLIKEVLESPLNNSERAEQISTGTDYIEINDNRGISSTENQDGSVCVKNGKIIISYPKGTGKYASVSPGDGVMFLVNGMEVGDKVLLTEDIHLQIVFDEEKPQSNLEITISDDGLEAYLTVQRQPYRKYRLADQEASQHLVLKKEVVEEILPPPVDLAEVLEELESLGIKSGIDFAALERELKAPTGEKIVIARGRPPVLPQDAYVEYLFSNDQRISKEMRDAGRIDYLDKGQFQSVEMGTVLAVKRPPVPGKKGVTVTGKEIPVGEPKDVQINVGEGACLVNNGQKAVAVIAGRPVLAGKQRLIKVLPELTVPGDVNISTGHIRFKGDVVIHGNVLEGLIVQATGRVTVLGNVYSGQIFAGGSIFIGQSLIGGLVTAGGEGAFLNRILPGVNLLLKMLANIKKNIKQLKSNPNFSVGDLNIKGDGNLIKLLIDMKYKELPAIVANLSSHLKSVRYKPSSEIINCINVMTEKLTGLGPLNIKSLDELTDIEKMLAEITRIAEESAEIAEADVTVKYVQNATVEATGSIYIAGQGCYRTNLYAGKDITIAGICRGGEITAEGDISVSQLGAGSAVLTKISTKESGVIKAQKVYPNVILKIGHHSYKAHSEMQNVYCCWDDDKGLFVSSK